MDTQLLSQLADILGFDIDVTPVFIGFGIFVTAFLKDRWKISGRGIDIALIVLMLGLNAVVYLPAQKWIAWVAGAGICYILTIGTWSGAKQLVHKIGK